MPSFRSPRLLCAVFLVVCLRWAAAQDARGITVGAPKAFDNRTLNLMLERLNGQLAGVNLIDQKSLSQAIGAIQGSSEQDTASSLTIQGAAATTATTPTTPSLPDLIAAPSALTNLKYGMSSSDLLSEQVDLTYQIFNIQMLLDRSLSDRLLNPGFTPRLQTVVGLNVSIDPPRDAENAVAVVEITLTKNDDPCEKDGTCDKSEACKPATAGGESPSLVAAMPQEHSYNSVALNSKSHAFGGSAVMKLVTVGFNERRRGQTYFMYRDNDTIAFERQTCPATGRLTFGWAFRPVLGRKSVSPGSRQLFAVVALPENDSYIDQPNQGEATYAAEIKAYWRKYDPKTLTSANDSEIRPWSKMGHIFSLGTSLTYPPSGVTKLSNYQLVVPLTSTYLKSLSPDVKTVSWRPIGTKQASIAIKGQNLFYDTQVAIGDKILTGPKDGLRLVSDQSMDIVTDRSALYGEVAILGRYGPAIILEREFKGKTSLTIRSATYGTPLGGYITLIIEPRFNDGSVCLEEDDLDDGQLGQPMVFLNGAPVSGAYSFPADSKNCLSVVALVPEAAMPKLGAVVTLKFPFLKGLSGSLPLYDPSSVYKLQALTANEDYLLSKLDGAFVPPNQMDTKALNWRLLIGTDKPITLTDPCPATPPKGAIVFCLLTPNDKFARIIIGKTYHCTDAAEGNPASAPEAPAPTTPPQGQAAPQKKKAKAQLKSCVPKTFLLQSAITQKDKTLYWNATYPLTVSTGDTNSGDQSASNPSSKPTLDANQSQSVNQHDMVWRSFTGKSLSALGAVTAGEASLQINPAKDGNSVAVLVPKWVTVYPAEVDLTFHDKQGVQIGTAKIIIKPGPSGASK